MGGQPGRIRQIRHRVRLIAQNAPGLGAKAQGQEPNDTGTAMISWGMPPSYDSRHAISTTDSSQ